jgi:hypothetical protein
MTGVDIDRALDRLLPQIRVHIYATPAPIPHAILILICCFDGREASR